ncbi:hypothetical protein ACU4GD_14740 [Cupriavidus basilensis]
MATAIGGSNDGVVWAGGAFTSLTSSKATRCRQAGRRRYGGRSRRRPCTPVPVQSSASALFILSRAGDITSGAQVLKLRAQQSRLRVAVVDLQDGAPAAGWTIHARHRSHAAAAAGERLSTKGDITMPPLAHTDASGRLAGEHRKVGTSNTDSGYRRVQCESAPAQPGHPGRRSRGPRPGSAAA